MYIKMYFQEKCNDLNSKCLLTGFLGEQWSFIICRWRKCINQTWGEEPEKGNHIDRGASDILLL